MGEIAIEVRGLRKSVGAKEAVAGVDLEIAASYPQPRALSTTSPDPGVERRKIASVLTVRTSAALGRQRGSGRQFARRG